jgi:hypothetical protein
VSYEYDANGNVMEERYFDKSGVPVLDKNGIAGKRWERDDRGLPVAITHLDRDDRASPDNNGVAIIRQTFDGRFLLTRKLYFSADGQPVYDKSGAAGAAYERNAHDAALSETFLDRDGMSPASASRGYATWRVEYDAVGNMVRERYFDPTGLPALWYLCRCLRPQQLFRW